MDYQNTNYSQLPNYNQQQTGYGSGVGGYGSTGGYDGMSYNTQQQGQVPVPQYNQNATTFSHVHQQQTPGVSQGQSQVQSQSGRTYDFRRPYNQPIVPLKVTPKFHYTVQNNPYSQKSNHRDTSTIRSSSSSSSRGNSGGLKRKTYPKRVYTREVPVLRSTKSDSIRSRNRSRRGGGGRGGGGVGDENEVMNVVLPINTSERQALDLSCRYPNLYIPSDFTKVICHWLKLDNFELDERKIGSKIICDNFLGSEESKEKESNKKEVASLDKFKIKHNAKVMFGNIEDNNEKKHLFERFKFLVGKKDRSGLLCLGGSWIKELDGDNPNDDITVKRTAIRTVRDYCGLDLRKCKEWIKFIEIFYHRPSEEINGENFPEIVERTVVFWIKDISSLFPSVEEFDIIYNSRKELVKSYEQKKKKSPIPPAVKDKPDSPVIYCVTKKKKLKSNYKTMMISLDGVLDYNIDDRLEKTFEMSLFAESFKEMVQKNRGNSILKFLSGVGNKRKRKIEKDDTSPPQKKSKSKTLQSFKHFDRYSDGYMKVNNLEDLLMSLNNGLSKGDIRKLVKTVAEENDDVKYEKIEFDDTEEMPTLDLNQ